MALIKCPECGKEFSSYAKACPQCGFPVNAMTENDSLPSDCCPECGTTVVNDSSDCPDCGKPINDNRSVPINDTIMHVIPDNTTKQKTSKHRWIIGGIVAVAVLLIAGAFLLIWGTNGMKPQSNGNTKERTLEEMKQDAEKFKSELPESYVVLGECIDSLVQKVYFTNRVSPWDDCYLSWQDYLDDIDDNVYPKSLLALQAKDTSATFIKVYNLQSKDTSYIDFSKLYNDCRFDDYQAGIRFSYCAKGKLFFSVPACREGSVLYCINVYSDEVSIIDDSGCVRDVRVEGNKLVYSKGIVTNMDEDVCCADYQWVKKDFSIDM